MQDNYLTLIREIDLKSYKKGKIKCLIFLICFSLQYKTLLYIEKKSSFYTLKTGPDGNISMTDSSLA